MMALIKVVGGVNKHPTIECRVTVVCITTSYVGKSCLVGGIRVCKSISWTMFISSIVVVNFIFLEIFIYSVGSLCIFLT